jgi:hypothetical protein
MVGPPEKEESHMSTLRVFKHVEGATSDVVVRVHGVPVAFTDNEGEAESFGEQSWVRFSFNGEEGVRVRVEIRKDVAIVYREEAQIPMSQSSYDSCDRYFRL